MVLMVTYESILSRIKTKINNTSTDHLWLNVENVKQNLIFKKTLTIILRRTNVPLVMFASKSVKPKLL